MKKQKNKQTIKASKLAKAENIKNKTITVKNAEGEPDTEAEILIQNKISYTPKVSVIIPVYNTEEYLRECLDSVINQTLKEIEIICVDDGSTDSSLEILKEYAKKDNRFTVITQKNLHAGVARNAGLAVAKGEYLSFLDSDDFFELNMLEKCYNGAKNAAAEILIFEIDKFDNITKKFTPQKWLLKEEQLPSKQVFSALDIRKYIYQFSCSWAWNKLFLHTYIVENNIKFQSLKRTNDLYFSFLALSLAKRMTILKNCLLHYRVSLKSSLQSTNEYSPYDWYHALEKLKKELCARNTYITFEKSFVNCALGSSIYNYNSIANQHIKDLLLNNINKNISYELDIRKHLANRQYFYNQDFLKSFELNLYNNIKVSILVPIYNVEKYLRECLDSIKNQTLKDIEVLLLDDGSTDSCPQICDEYCKNDSRFKVIHKPNSGYGATMNIGLDNATGEYIGIVESDDFIRPNMYEEEYEVAKQYNLDVLKADFRVFEGEEDKRVFTYRNMSNNKKYYNCLLKPIEQIDVYNTNSVIWSGIYSRNFIVNNKIRFNETPGASYQDNGFYFQTYSLAQRMYIMDKDFYQLRRDNPNSSVKSKFKAFVMCEEYKFIENFIKKHNNFPKHIWNIYYLKKYHNYMWTFNRISNDLKVDFLKQFSKEMSVGLRNNYITEPVFNRKQISDIKKIVKNYIKYYNNKNILFYKSELENWWYRIKKYALNLNNPRTFNEKIQWLKLYDSTPIKTRLADKYLVRDWVKEKIGEEYLIPLLGVYDKFEDIDFDKLPNQFVMKCNHGSGWNIIVKDKSKLDLKEAKEKLNEWMSANYAFKCGYELHYRDITPKIVIEKFLNEISESLYDYRFFCCNGKVEQIWLDVHSGTPEHKRKIYDRNWNELNIIVKWPRLKTNIKKPENLEKMIALSEKMSKEFAFVRVDFYDINDKIYFGEMTFTSMSGTGKFEPAIEDLKLGNMIKLPKLAYNIDTGEYYKLPKKSKLKPWLLFPYNLCKNIYLKHEQKKLLKKQIQKQLKPCRIDIKNFGTENNAVDVITTAKVNKPSWLANAQGQGAVVETNQNILKLTIKAIQNGKLRLEFKGMDKRANGVRFPLWVDYKSIKINGKEILSSPITTWHDKPFRYEIPVKDGQIVTVEVIQKYHQYSKTELKEVILKLNPASDYIKSHIKKVTKKIYRKITNKSGFLNKIKRLKNKFSFAHKTSPVLDLIRQNQATLQQLQTQNNELKKEIEVLKKLIQSK